ncbi:phosphatidylinositol mannoside acyltransferase [Georgenia sp. 311]|uniref:Phosphatidylinositol mannoside acyltransferase n=1 Tax=Georgenia wutianyii TaxID=2585135 RepID=A0ABX5VQP9_9MICO|nr:MULTISPECIES: phosphatidylinositol mannoside acyltransferase [Georgenia]QDB79379.1 phosphatidylinositol mannoside acyltransferase [Georgenia wutianyii]TNC19568.1 phosphatidylinositol mannoside acyltransferase [Georgenia sp. 311]
MNLDPGRLLIVAARVVPRLPAWMSGAIFRTVADVATTLGIGGTHQLRRNLARAVPEASERELRRLTRKGMRSYMRYYEEALRLPAASDVQLAARVRIEGSETVRTELAAGRPVVVAVAHLGNWDLAGAWATKFLAPVVTVAEHLQPEELFQGFLAFRRSLGMTIIPLEKDGSTFRALLRACRSGAPIVPLLADRDLSRTSVDVELLGERARVAPGPAALALATGNALVTATIRYERLRGPRRQAAGSRWGVVVDFGERIDPPVGAAREEAIAAMTQRWVSEIGDFVRRYPEDWHMLQPVFVADLDPARLKPAGSVA